VPEEEMSLLGFSPRTRDETRPHTVSDGEMKNHACCRFLLLGLAVGGCGATAIREPIGVVVNGKPGTASLKGSALEGMAPAEAVVNYPGRAGETLLAHVTNPVRIDLVRTRSRLPASNTPEEPEETGSSRSKGKPGKEIDLSPTPQLVVSKWVQIRDEPKASRVVLDISEEKLENVPISFVFEIRNIGSGLARQARLVDALPRAFRAQKVEVYDNGGHAVWRYLPPIFPVAWMLGFGIPFEQSKSISDFDRISYELRPAEGANLLIVEMHMNSSPLESTGGSGSFVVLRVTGHLDPRFIEEQAP
jgi:hypothetical protein